uniref:Heat shock protein 60 n=1 Tax=Bombiscardovia coagulans TaxID=686666 RepID=A0A1X6RW68_9BIFI|nr:Heat shock protein 60 [Bombiscardovia coagulans]
MTLLVMVLLQLPFWLSHWCTKVLRMWQLVPTQSLCVVVLKKPLMQSLRN